MQPEKLLRVLLGTLPERVGRSLENPVTPAKQVVPFWNWIPLVGQPIPPRVNDVFKIRWRWRRRCMMVLTLLLKLLALC